MEAVLCNSDHMSLKLPVVSCSEVVTVEIDKVLRSHSIPHPKSGSKFTKFVAHSPWVPSRIQILSFPSPSVCWRHTVPLLVDEFAVILVAKKKGNKNLVG